MPTQTYLDVLKARHKACETELADAIAHPSASDQEIAEIKHRKLHLKDEIAALEAKLRSAGT